MKYFKIKSEMILKLIITTLISVLLLSCNNEVRYDLDLYYTYLGDINSSNCILIHKSSTDSLVKCVCGFSLDSSIKIIIYNNKGLSANKLIVNLSQEKFTSEYNYISDINGQSFTISSSKTNITLNKRYVVVGDTIVGKINFEGETNLEFLQEPTVKIDIFGYFTCIVMPTVPETRPYLKYP